MPPVAIHGLMIQTLFLILHKFCSERQLGRLITEMPFVLTYNSQWVKGSRVPDLMFFTQEKWQTYTATIEKWQNKPFIMIPDLAIEVVSQNDSYTELQNKVDHYLQDGVQLVWVVDPQRKTVSTFSGNQYYVLSENDILRGGEVVQDLEIPLQQMFAEVE
jgi:Uma2 family endonuclease